MATLTLAPRSVFASSHFARFKWGEALVLQQMTIDINKLAGRQLLRLSAQFLIAQLIANVF